jgi:hypothetical protein
VKALVKVKFEKEFEYPIVLMPEEQVKPPQASALLWLERSQDTERDLRKLWEEKIEAPATNLMLALVNMGDAPKDIHQFIPPQYDIAGETDYDLVELRNELRDFWDEVSKERGPTGATDTFGDNTKVARSLYKWWKRYDLDSDGWKIFWETGTFFPTQKNFRGIIARILFDKRRRLARCPGCSQYFIKSREDQKYCLAVGCLRQANNLRQQKYQRAHKKSPARKSRRSA